MLLNEFTADDPIKGLRDLLGILSKGWKAPTAAIAKDQAKAVKKAAPEQVAAAKRVLSKTVHNIITKPSVTAQQHAQYAILAIRGDINRVSYDIKTDKDAAHTKVLPNGQKRLPAPDTPSATKPEAQKRIGHTDPLRLTYDDPNAADLGGIIDQINDANDAAILLTSLMLIAQSTREVDANFVRNSREFVSAEEAKQFMEQALTFDELPLGPTIVKFISEHESIFMSMFEIRDNLTINAPAIANRLRNALAQTEDVDAQRNKRAAILGVHYFLHHIAVSTHEVYLAVFKALEKEHLVIGDPATGFKLKGANRPIATPAGATAAVIQKAGQKMGRK